MVTRCRPLLGTFVEITVPDGEAETIDAAMLAIAEVQRAMSFHDEDSDLGRMRSASIGSPVEVAPQTVEVLRLALDLFGQSDRLFDVTIGHELVRAGFLPRPGGGNRLKWSRGDCSDIEIAGPRHVRCHRPLLIDLGGIAKGYAVDKAVEALEAAGVAQGLVNAGGDLRMFGPATWTIGLRGADGGVSETVTLADCAVASSANLRNRRRRWGRLRTPHIGFGRRPIAATGRVTVVAPRCVIADAMTKIAMADCALAERMLARHGGYVLKEIPDRMAA